MIIKGKTKVYSCYDSRCKSCFAKTVAMSVVIIISK